MTGKEVCQLLGIDPKTLWRWNFEGIAPPRVRIKKRGYYTRESVNAWIESLSDSALSSLASGAPVRSADRPSPTGQIPHFVSTL